MSKLVFARDVREGDVIRLYRVGHSHNVERVGWDSLAGSISFFLECEGRFFWKNYRADSWLELLHRPLSETRSVGDVRKDILVLAGTVEVIAQLGEEEFSSHLGHLRRLLDEYELGKSLEDKKLAGGDCEAGRCVHAKTAAGMCAILALTTPTSRDC